MAEVVNPLAGFILRDSALEIKTLSHRPGQYLEFQENKDKTDPIQQTQKYGSYTRRKEDYSKICIIEVKVIF